MLRLILVAAGILIFLVSCNPEDPLPKGFENKNYHELVDSYEEYRKAVTENRKIGEELGIINDYTYKSEKGNNTPQVAEAAEKILSLMVYHTAISNDYPLETAEAGAIDLHKTLTEKAGIEIPELEARVEELLEVDPIQRTEEQLNELNNRKIFYQATKSINKINNEYGEENGIFQVYELSEVYQQNDGLYYIQSAFAIDSASGAKVFEFELLINEHGELQDLYMPRSTGPFSIPMTYDTLGKKAVLKDNSDEASENSSETNINQRDSPFLIPHSDVSKVTSGDIENFSLNDIKIAKNEIYARHGYVFETENLQQYFDSQSWYEKDPTYQGELEDIEAYNVRYLENAEEIDREKENQGTETQKLSLAEFSEAVNEISMEQLEYSILHRPSYQEETNRNVYEFTAVTSENIKIFTDKENNIEEVHWISKEKLTEEVLYNIQFLLLGLEENVSQEEINEFLFNESSSHQPSEKFLVELDKSENDFTLSITLKDIQ